MPNALEWFCFPGSHSYSASCLDGIHLHRPLPPLIMRFIPTPLLVGIEFIIPSLPCDSLCTPPPSPSRLSHILHVLLSIPPPSPAAPFFNIAALSHLDFLPGEVLAAVCQYLRCHVRFLSSLHSQLPLIPASTHASFLRISFDDAGFTYIPTIILHLIKRTLKCLPQDTLILLFYLLSFIHLVLRSESRSCQVFCENEVTDSSSLSSEQATPTSTPVTDADTSVCSPLHVGDSSDQASLEAIAEFFFEPLWQLPTAQYSLQQRSTLFSVFLVMILQYDFLFDYLLEQLREDSVQEEENGGKEVEKEEEMDKKEEEINMKKKEEQERKEEVRVTNDKNSVFTAQLPTTTHYTTLCTATTKYYCCCYFTYHQHTLTSLVRTILPHTPIPDSFRQEELAAQQTIKQWKENVLVPVCFFVLSRLPAPAQLCRLLPRAAAVLGEKKKEEVKQLLSFLLCDAILPPSGFTIAFTVNGEECALSGPPFFNRGSSRRLSLSS